MTMPYPPQPPAVAPACYRHPDRPTYIGCTRCGRPACPECLSPASDWAPVSGGGTVTVRMVTGMIE